jgi:hypothetical protein
MAKAFKVYVEIPIHGKSRENVQRTATVKEATDVAISDNGGIVIYARNGSKFYLPKEAIVEVRPFSNEEAKLELSDD